MYVHWIDKDKITRSVKCSNKDTAQMLYDEIEDYKEKMLSHDSTPLWNITKYLLMGV